jgi:protein TonB
VVKVGEVRPPRKLKDRKPVYPPSAVSLRASGTVVLECTIGTDGRVSALRVVKSAPLFDAAALEAVRDWVYTPTLLDGVPVSVLMTVTATFLPRG